MPAMPRIPGKPTKIAFRVIDIPANLQLKRSKKEKRLKARLLVEDTIRVRGAY